jgi:predicted dehydrogenase
MKHGSSRREFLKQTAAAGAGLWVTGGAAWARKKTVSANEKLNIGVIGVGGRGRDDLQGVASENIVALCDIDDKILDRAIQQFPKAARYNDFRKLLDQRDLDAVVVATPDHVHAFATTWALHRGLHVYCEKPLTHSVYEARHVAEMAARHKLATQMGNQGHSNDTSRRIVEMVQAGAIGPVREVHAWTDRPIWPQGIDRPTDTPPSPSNIHWDLWLGPAPERPYNPAYQPFKWRGWWDFGTGAPGDMGCHVLDVAYWALKLGSPTAVEAEAPPPHAETAPQWEIVRYEFPARGDLPPLKLTWYDGGKKPPSELFEGQPVVDNGSLLIGDKGKLYLAGSYGEQFKLLPENDFAGYKPPEPTIPNSPGHHAEWIQACKTGSATGSNFGYAGPLTEIVLLGNVATRLGKRIEWDGPAMKVTNASDAEPLIRPEYRKGWKLR